MATSTYNLIASQIVGSGGASSITFSSIPQTYTDLLLKMSTADSRSTPSVSDILVNFNGTGVGTNVSANYFYGNGSSVTGTTGTQIAFGDGSQGSIFGNSEVYIANYTSSNYKPYSSDSIAEINSTAGYQLLIAGLWSSTAAITSISLTPYSSPFGQYSTFYLYGIKNS